LLITCCAVLRCVALPCELLCCRSWSSLSHSHHSNSFFQPVQMDSIWRRDRRGGQCGDAHRSRVSPLRREMGPSFSSFPILYRAQGRWFEAPLPPQDVSNILETGDELPAGRKDSSKPTTRRTDRYKDEVPSPTCGSERKHNFFKLLFLKSYCLSSLSLVFWRRFPTPARMSARGPQLECHQHDYIEGVGV
jgi:hypothetical protein